MRCPESRLGMIVIITPMNGSAMLHLSHLCLYFIQAPQGRGPLCTPVEGAHSQRRVPAGRVDI